MAKGHDESTDTATHTVSVTQTQTQAPSTTPASASQHGPSTPLPSIPGDPPGPTSTTAGPLTVTPTTGAAANASSSSDTGAKVAVGVIVALLVLGAAAALSYVFLRRRWRLKNRVVPGDYGPGGGLRRQWSLYEATSLEDHDDDAERGQTRPGGGDALRQGEIGLYDPTPTTSNRAERRQSRASSTSDKLAGPESPRSRWARTGRQRSSIGLDQEPEAYTMFGSSTTSLGLYRDEDPYAAADPRAPPGLGHSTSSRRDAGDGNTMEMGQITSDRSTPARPPHSRQTSRTSVGSTDKDRWNTLMEDASRYPTMGSGSSSKITSRRLSMASETFDPFSDASPSPAGKESPNDPKIVSPPPAGAMKTTNPFKGS